MKISDVMFEAVLHPMQSGKFCDVYILIFLKKCIHHFFGPEKKKNDGYIVNFEMYELFCNAAMVVAVNI